MSQSDVQAAFCAVLCDEWARAGVTDAVVSPGSRSTPLVMALDAEPRIRVSVVLDERSAGFTALGLGLATGRPAVVVTTSGTASVELHPSVVEAGQAHAPMIAVTTDRPPELHHVAAPQTVEQTGLFGGVVRGAFDPGVPDAGSSAMWRSLACRVVAEAADGPVHLNLPFREPLLGDPARGEMPAGREGGEPWHRPGGGALAADPGLLSLLRARAGGRGLIVAGAGAGPAGPVLDLGGRLGWPVLADPRSGCRVPSPRVISTADPLLRTEGFRSLVPEFVLRIGAPWASKVLNQWMAGLPPTVPQVLLDPYARWADPERSAARVVKGAVRPVADALADLAPPASDWVDRWTCAERSARSALDGLLSGELSLSEPAVAAACALTGATLVVSSSMPVRDVEWFAPAMAGQQVLSNRGANGIDGVLSTAIGVALAEPARPTVALIGDLAFAYDAGALLWAASRPIRLSVVVVDNDGGGIFSFLPQATALEPDRFERYWGTPHGIDLVALAAAYGVAARRVRSRAELDAFLEADALSQPGVRMAVVPSDRAANVGIHDRLYAAVAAAVGDPA
jgi:2-succinyl-5-enolpyruvyl-6-hydroxy-3-cyclohexene-1-carboxylate synthase